MSVVDIARLIQESQNLSQQMQYYTSCILTELAAFSSGKESKVEDISHPGNTLENSFVFRHPPLHSHDVDKVFDYRGQELATLKAIVDDLVMHKEYYNACSSELVDRLQSIDQSLESMNKKSVDTPNNVDVESIIVTSLSSHEINSQPANVIQHLLNKSNIRGISDFPNDQEYQKYLKQQIQTRYSDIRTQNRILSRILKQCRELKVQFQAFQSAEYAL